MVENRKTIAVTARSPSVFLFERFVKILDRAEHFEPDELEHLQKEFMTNLLRHATNHVPFYKNRLGAVCRVDGSVDWTKWSEIPILQRSDIEAHGAELTSSLVPPDHGKVEVSQSSGTTGSPIQFKVTDMTNATLRFANLRLFNWHRIDGSLKLARIRPWPSKVAPYPKGRKSKRWASGVENAGPSGPMCELNINTPIHLQAEWLLRERPNYLNTFPSNALALAEFFTENCGEVGNLSLAGILTYGETVTDKLRDACASAFGARVIDCYSSLECGYLALECPASRCYHVPGELVFVEILDDNGVPVETGELGRVIVTPLWNYAMPLIRYNTNDFAVAGPNCVCGRPGRAIARVAGRSRNLFRFANFGVVLPALTTKMWNKFMSSKQWQVAQVGPSELEVRLVPRKNAEPMNFKGMTNYIRELYGNEIIVTYKQMDEIPKSASGKFEQYICELSD